jgi:NDP-sugar pyrophosphorylase family protein
MKILIPMSGIGKRFKDAGYSSPKYLLNTLDKSVLEHILNLFPGEEDINLIMNKKDFYNSEIKSKVDEIVFNKNIKIHYIENHKKGPGYALLSSGLLETEDEVFINYCDFSNFWNWNDVKKQIDINKYDGLLPAYKGLHLHSIYGNFYAFIKNNKNKVLSIKEKEPFTDDPIQEYASTGGYYFASGKIAKQYLEKLFESEYLINGEAYISSAYELMLQDGLNVGLYNIEHFFQWGTPEDFEEFNYCIDEVTSLKNDNQIDLTEINLILPVAGEGKRFKNDGYETPKILLDVDNKKMITKIISKFSNQVSTNILTTSELEPELKKILNDFQDIKIRSVDFTTKGQADSSRLLINEITNDKPVFIQSGDTILESFNSEHLNNQDYDLVVFTKKNYRRATNAPLNYGWIYTSGDQVVDTVIKGLPKNSEYSMILGSFIFRNKDVFNKLYKDIENKGYKELHIDFMIPAALERKLIVKEFSLDKSLVLGTPIEYKLYNYAQHIYNSMKE